MSATDNIKTLQMLLDTLSSDHLGKEEFTKAFKQVLDFVKQIDKKTAQEIEDMKMLLSEMAEKVKMDNESLKGELKGQVNDVFVGDQMNRMKGDMQMSASEMKKMMDSHMAEMRMAMEKKMGEMKDGEMGPMGPMGKDGSPDSADKIVAKLESLEGDERLDASAIKGLEDVMKDVKGLKGRPVAVGITGRDLFKDYDLSSQLDGVTTVFNIPAVWNIISVNLSSFPYGSLRKNIDFTYTPTTITFTSQIEPATQLATGQSCILTIVTA